MNGANSSSLPLFSNAISKKEGSSVGNPLRILSSIAVIFAGFASLDTISGLPFSTRINAKLSLPGTSGIACQVLFPASRYTNRAQ